MADDGKKKAKRMSRTHDGDSKAKKAKKNDNRESNDTNSGKSLKTKSGAEKRDARIEGEKGKKKPKVEKTSKKPCGDKEMSRTPTFPKSEFDESTCSVRVKCGKFGSGEVKDAFKNALSIKKEEDFFVLEYPSKEHALVDIRANRKPSARRERSDDEYMNNKFILINLSYKETEESIGEVFGKYGEIEKIVIQRNKDGMSVGRAVITFKSKAVIRDEIVMTNKPIYIERIRKPLENKTRFFLGKLHKSLSIVALRKILASVKCKPKDIRVLYSENKRNKGYGFIEYGMEKEANAFVSKFDEIKHLLGTECFYEYSNEKASVKNRKR